MKESSDKVFIKKLNDILETNYFREDFGVPELSAEVGFSHTQLHRKIKAEFGKSTSQFIREFRLEKAMEMLKGNVISASEVAYKVGFSSPTYFNKCFNDYFGYPPGKVKYNLSNNNMNLEQRVQNKLPVNNTFRKSQLSKWKISGIILILIALAVVFGYLIFIKEKPKVPDGLDTETSVAVMPFKILSEDKSNQYFADGVMDDIINHLSTIKELRVISRTTMDQFKETTKTVPEIAEELKVSYIIESSIQKYQDSVRLIIQLTDAKIDKNIWSQEFKSEYKNIFTLESDIAKKIAAKLKATLSPKEIERLERVPTENMEAYNLYLQGIYAFNSNNVDSLLEYEKLLYRCLELDPNFAMAYAALARSKIQRMRGLIIPITEENINEVKALAIKSIELNDNARAHASLGWLYLWLEWNWDEAENQFRLAIQINPNDAGGHVYLSEFLYYIRGDFAEARKHLDQALFLAPYAYYPRGVSSSFYFNEGNFNKSIEEAQKMKEIDSNNSSSYWIKFRNYISLSQEDKAVEELINVWETNAESTGNINSVEEAYTKSGISGVYQWLINNENNNKNHLQYNIAQFYALAGEKENAIRWLEKSFELHEPSMPYIKYDPLFKDLRTDPRFLAILDMMDLGSY